MHGCPWITLNIARLCTNDARAIHGHCAQMSRRCDNQINVGTSDIDVGISDICKSDIGTLPLGTLFWSTDVLKNVLMRLDLSYITKQAPLNARKTDRRTAKMGPGFDHVEPFEWGLWWASLSLTVCKYNWCQILGAKFLVLHGITEILSTGW